MSTSTTPSPTLILSEEHIKVCETIKRFIKKNKRAICNGIGDTCEGKKFTTVEDSDGRVWVDGFVFQIEVYIPFDIPPSHEKLNKERILRIMDKLVMCLSSNIDDITLTYNFSTKMLIVHAELLCCEG